MKRAFADTSFYVAALSPHDVSYQAAREILAHYDGVVVTSEYILLELGSYLSKAPDRPAFMNFVKWATSDKNTKTIWSSEELFEQGLALFSARPDKNWSLTDCLSFAIMQDLGIREAFTLDHHFEQAGFKIVMGDGEE